MLHLAQFFASWGIRSSEFGLVLFLTAALPGTLFYVSIYSLARSLSATLFSSWIGARIDGLDRLQAVRLSIVFQRIPVAMSCIIFIFFSWTDESKPVERLMFAVLVLLACVDKVASIANIVAIERDWIIVITEVNNLRRQDLNASMRRVDLLAKLVAPLIISILDVYSRQLSLWVIIGMNIASIFLEFYVIDHIYTSAPEFGSKAPQPCQTSPCTETEVLLHPSQPQEEASGLRVWLRRAIRPWIEYVHSSVFLASFSNAIIYWTVLSFGGQTIAYLLNIGFLPLEISILRIASVAAELGGTWIAPILMQRIGPIKAGLWFLLWQIACIGFFAGFIITGDIISKSAGVTLAVGITFKRLGLWGSDLSIQFIVQEVSLETSANIPNKIRD